MPLDRALDELAAYLKYEIEEGRARVALELDTLAVLRGKRLNPTATEAAPPPPSPPPSPSPSPSPSRPAIVTAPPPVTATQAPPSREAKLAAIALRISTCEACELCRGRHKTVPGQGHAHPEIAFVGEGPGYDEDRQGLAFVGKAGELLTKMIVAMGYSRDEVWIGNVVKCRPPDNRTPTDDEMNTCLPYLRAQLAILQPRIIVCLGATATKGLLATTESISRLRGTWQRFEGIDVMPTFHPAYLLRNPAAKHDTWSDLKDVLQRLGRPVPVPGTRKD